MITKQKSGRNFNRSLGRLESYEKTANGLRILVGDPEEVGYEVLVSIYRDSVIRVTASKVNREYVSFSYAVVAEAETVNFTLVDTDTELELRTACLLLRIQKDPLRFSFEDLSGQVLSQDDPGFGITWLGDEVAHYRTLQEGERFVGLGEKSGGLDRRGKAFTHWNTDDFAYETDADPLYMSTPFFIGLHHKKAYGIFLDNTHKTTFNFGASSDRFSWYSAEDGALDYYFFHQEDVSGILKDYSWLTGRIEMPPLWSLGYQQCRYSYYPDSEVLNVARTFRDKDIPADVIYLDIHYMDAYKVFTFHPDRFPDPAGLLKELKEMGFEVVVIVDPGIKDEAGYPVLESGKEQGVFATLSNGDPYRGEVWPGWSHFPDFTDPAAREWWGKYFQVYLDAGISGFWNDMNEPACWGQSIPNLLEFNFEGEGATHKQARNVYGMQMARATREGVRKLMGNRRAFLLNRAGYSGVQRYTAQWTGDNVASDGHMLAGIRLINSLGLTGVPFAGYDVGGFAGTASVKLFARWIQVGAFSPLFRGHSMINSQDAEPWAYGEEVEEISRNYIRLRYQLMPYTYSLFYEAHRTGMPVVRSLAIEHPYNPAIYDKRFQNQYSYGPFILVAPVESEKEITKVYLPPGQWYDFFTDELHAGGQEIFVECPIEKLPLYVRGGGILPMEAARASLSMPSGEILSLHFYLGTEASSFEYYEDDGSTYDHLEGKYNLRTIQMSPKKREIRIGASTGSLPGKFSQVKVYFHGFGKEASKLKVRGKPLETEVSTHAFTDPISAFDPLGKPKGSKMQIPEIKSILLPISSEEIHISW